MSYSQLILPTIDEVRQALAGPLPGQPAQIEMAPQPPADSKVNRWDNPDDCRKAGVLLLLYPHITLANSSELHLVLIRRAEYPGAHSGQISLPGGQHEAGETLQETALRETYEEVGVLPKTVEMMGQLTALYTPPSHFCIYPFVAYRSSRADFNIDPLEVAELIEAPLSLLLDPAIYKEEIWHFKKYGTRRVPFFDVFGHKVWGATAMILKEFLTLLSKTVNDATGPTHDS